MQQSLSVNVLHFFKNFDQHITNIRDTFFRSLNIKESQENISCTMDNHLKIEEQNKIKNYDLDLCNKA